MGYVESLNLIDPWVYQQVSAASTWAAVASGTGEMIRSGYLPQYPQGAWTPGGPSGPYNYYEVRDPHDGLWVGATTGVSGSMTAEAYAASVLVLDYPIVLPTRLDALYGLLGSIYLPLTSILSLSCELTLREGYWPSSRVHDNNQLRIYVKYLGLYEAPYTDPDLLSWFSPASLSAIPTLSGPLDAYSIRTRNAQIEDTGYVSCGSNTVYHSSLFIPYFIPFDQGQVLDAILADLDSANANPTNSRYALNVRFLRLLLVSNHLVDNIPPLGDETFLAANTIAAEWGFDALCGWYRLSFPPRLMCLPARATQVFAIDHPRYTPPDPIVQANIYEAPRESNYATTLWEKGGYVVDTTTGFIREELSYSEARSFVEVASSPSSPALNLATSAPYGDSLVSPATSRYMETPAQPSAIVVGREAPAASGLLYGDTRFDGFFLQQGWSQRGYSGEESVPYSSYWSAYPSLGVVLGDGGTTYTLYPAPTFSLDLPPGSTVTLGFGASVVGDAAILTTANGALVWG